jgi:hypothetical protein
MSILKVKSLFFYKNHEIKLKPQTQHTIVDLVGVKLIELMFITSSQLFEYFSRLFTPEV